MKQETKRRIEISNLHEFADSLILIDNRIERCKKHQASTIVLIAISAVICGADTWNSIEDFGKSKEFFFAAKLSILMASLLMIHLIAFLALVSFKI